MSTTTFVPLSAQPAITRRVRAYFAPVDRVNKVPSIFDPSVNGQFSLSAPPAPWVDLGWIENFGRKSESKFTELVTGSPGITQFQARETIDAVVSFRFKVWSKLTMALSAGSQHMNLLTPAAGSTANGSGSKGITAVSLAVSSTATFLSLAATDAAKFPAGSMVAVDVDYAAQTGFVGSGVYAAYVSSASAVNSDPDYIRRVTFNVARVLSVTTTGTATGLQLAQPLLAGVPASGMKVQPLLGFVDREGGSFFQEWSALFVMPGEQGDRILFHYPRLQALAGAAETGTALAAPLERIALNTNFRALPVTDANDGERVVCFRSYLPGTITLI
ncbi:hypothetical protein [Paracidobacterium acidisoli]|uniref:Uncharacterized protein n=1 Tax=Paracidobacterium acidisoli TaxID=2303751 RepID=A0A372IMN8_9BACT|nr:hypothetical protein [Paracidobacterium acidisoli]MBT9331870.1 hypothetical protein [Paracidobacterium acidisoli]